jgi:hypothetical protein
MVNITLNKHWTTEPTHRWWRKTPFFVGPETASMEPQFWGESPGVNSLWFSWHSQPCHNRPQTKKENRLLYVAVFLRHSLCSFKRGSFFKTCTKHYRTLRGTETRWHVDKTLTGTINRNKMKPTITPVSMWHILEAHLELCSEICVVKRVLRSDKGHTCGGAGVHFPYNHVKLLSHVKPLVWFKTVLACQCLLPCAANSHIPEISKDDQIPNPSFREQMLKKENPRFLKKQGMHSACPESQDGR